MHDFTVVEFPKLGWSFNFPSILADFTIPGINLHLTIHWYGVIIAFGFCLPCCSAAGWHISGR